MVRQLGNFPKHGGERIEVVGHGVEIVGGDQATRAPDVAGGEGRGVEEAPESAGRPPGRPGW